MIQDKMIGEIQELKRSGYSFPEAYSELRRRHTKVPCEKTVRKYYNMERAPDDNHAKVRKGMAFDTEPFRGAVIDIVASNPGCYMSSVYDVLVEAFVESGKYPALPGNEQTLRNFIHHLERTGAIEQAPDRRRRYDVMDTPPPGEKAQVDFGQYDCGKGLTVHFMCVVLWHSRLLGVYAQDHRFNAEEACRALHRFSCKCGGRVKTLVIDQDSVFVSEEVYGEVFETATFKAFLEEQDMGLWVCTKADPESKGCVENAVGFTKKRFFSARIFSDIEEVQRRLPAWVERANARIHQGTFQVPRDVFARVEKQALRPMLPSLYEAAPLFLKDAPVNSQPYVLYKSVKYSVPWEMCYTNAYYRVIGDKLHIYDSNRRHVCTHDVCPVKGSFIRLEEHRKEPASDWIDTAERLRRKYDCVEFQRFVNGFKRENPERHLGKQLLAVERCLDDNHASRALAAEVIAACCRGYRYRYTQFKAVFDLLSDQGADDRANVVMLEAPAGDVETRDMQSYQAAFESRCAS